MNMGDTFRKTGQDMKTIYSKMGFDTIGKGAELGCRALGKVCDWFGW